LRARAIRCTPTSVRLAASLFNSFERHCNDKNRIALVRRK
jgi:hypothetical protein